MMANRRSGTTRARLSDLVAPARALADRLAAQRDAGRSPCRKGCSACCYYLVSVSPPEARVIASRVMAMPPRLRRAIEDRIEKAALTLLRRPAPRGADASQLSAWYRSLDLACPFLKDDACAIYDDRPLVCREHSVVGTPKKCADAADASTPQEAAVSMAEVLARLCGQVTGRDAVAIMLPLAVYMQLKGAASREKTFTQQWLMQQFTDAVAAAMRDRAA
ncbi:MAG: YkgJ family cysteine cluster protein [Planctomycetaceae bacterium]|nr:YkgJ family cysteine cluster protein [Planctomycetaceae bacterium]